MNLRHASENIRKAAAMNGVWSGSYKPIFDPTEGWDSKLAEVWNSRKAITITVGEAEHAGHYTWQEIKDRR